MAKENHTYERRKKQVVVMRAVVLVTGLLQLFFGEFMIGIAILLSLLAISLPGFFTRNLIRAVPLEFEFILFVMVILQFVIGETLNFYDNVPYYDKVVHFSIPLFIGYISSLLAYTLMVTGNLRMTAAPTIILVILITLGIGAAWEIWEYAWDQLFGTHFQGSLTASPLIDTMNDLIADTLGGIFGALLALRYVRGGRKDENSRLTDLTKEIVQDFAPRHKNP